MTTTPYLAEIIEEHGCAARPPGLTVEATVSRQVRRARERRQEKVRQSLDRINDSYTKRIARISGNHEETEA